MALPTPYTEVMHRKRAVDVSFNLKMRVEKYNGLACPGEERFCTTIKMPFPFRYTSTVLFEHIKILKI